MILSLILLAQFCWEGQTCRPHVPIMPCNGTINSTPCPSATPTPTPTPRPTTTDTWGFDPGLKKDCVKRLGTDGNLTDIGHSCTPNWWVLNIAREGLMNGQVVRYADPTTDVSLTTVPGVIGSVTVNGTKDYPPPPTFTWGSFGEHIYYGGTTQILYLDVPIAFTFSLKIPRATGVRRVAAGIAYEYGGKSWQLEVNLFTSPEWGDPDPRPGVIIIPPAGTYASYYAVLDGGYYGYPVPTDKWTDYTVDFQDLMKISDPNFPVPGGKAKLVSISVMAESRENASVTFDVKGFAVLTGKSAHDALSPDAEDNTMVHWQTAKGLSYTVAAICNSQCSITIDGKITYFTGTKFITFTAPTDKDGSVAVRGATWSGLYRQGYSNEGVCTPLFPIINVM